MILCFSPVGSVLRVRARKFPAVVNCTAIDWFHEWPEDALVSVSARFLQETEGIQVGHWAPARPQPSVLVRRARRVCPPGQGDPAPSASTTWRTIRGGRGGVTSVTKIRDVLVQYF